MRRLWPYRTTLRNRRYLGAQAGAVDSRAWYRWHHVTKTAGAHPWSLVFPWVATNPHFVLLREAAAPLQSAPVVKLPATASEDDFFQLLAVLNSSAACFWLKQYSQSKGAPRANQLRAEEAWEHFYEFTSSRLEQLPLPGRLSGDHGRALDELGRRLASVTPATLCACEVPTRAGLDAARMQHERIHGQMIALQEELDWDIYRRYGLLSQPESDALIATPGSFPGLKPGERAFEIMLARRVLRGETETQWFARHGSTPITEFPEGLASGVLRCRGKAHRDDRAPSRHRPDRAARVQTPLAKRAVGTDGTGSAQGLATGPVRGAVTVVRDGQAATDNDGEPTADRLHADADFVA